MFDHNITKLTGGHYSDSKSVSAQLIILYNLFYGLWQRGGGTAIAGQGWMMVKCTDSHIACIPIERPAAAAELAVSWIRLERYVRS